MMHTNAKTHALMHRAAAASSRRPLLSSTFAASSRRSAKSVDPVQKSIHVMYELILFRRITVRTEPDLRCFPSKDGLAFVP